MVRILVIVAVVGCSSARSPDSRAGSAGSAGSSTVTTNDAAAATGEGLVARFEPPAGPMAASEAKLTFVVENRGSAEETIDLDQMESAIFAIEVFDARGTQRYTIPPGMPPANYQPRRAAIAPGASREFSVTLNVFSPELAPGTYTARLRPQSIPSDTVSFTIR